MPFRPSGYVGWCSTGATNVTEPTDAKKSYGWGVGEKPPSSYFNWIHQKQDQWIQYLAWRSTLDVVVYDDFVYPTGFAAPEGKTPSGFGFKWHVSNFDSDGFVLHGTSIANGGQQFPNMPGHVYVAANSVSGLQKLVQPIKVGDRDFRMEIVGYIETTGANVGSGVARFGFPDYCTFRSTGMSAFMLQIVPSGMSMGNATMIPVTASPSALCCSSGLALSKWVLERQGATMAIEVNDVRIATFRSTVFGASGRDMDFGVSQQGFGGLNARSAVDKLALWLGRNPV
jgi:hypothetical protein